MPSAVHLAWKRRAFLPAVLLALTASLTGCGSDDESDDPSIQLKADSSGYFVGETAKLTATFPKGAGRLEPGDIVVTSGQTITTPILTANTRYKLTVTDAGETATRNLDLAVKYRERVRTIAAPFARSEHAAVRLSDGRVVVFGGEDTQSVLPEKIYVFDPKDETFKHLGSLSSGRVAFTTISLDDGDILVYGGIAGLTSSPHAEIIDGQTGAVTPPTHQPAFNRLYAAASKLMDGRVLISGGAVSGQPYSQAVELYDPRTQKFTLLPGGLNVGRTGHTMVRINDRKFLIYGGVTLDNQPAPPELYDPVTGNSTTMTAPENGGRYLHVAHTLQDGTVWVLGGENFDGQPLTSVQRFDPAASTFLQSFNLATPRSSAAIARLTDARVLIVGGKSTASASSATQTTELLGAPTERRDGPQMSVKRSLHTATQLPNGKVLIFGGLDEQQRVLASAEIFE
ncbi:Kelch repeat-containing protein [Povalibacter sp.]|uniref:Kelch repeat-containing protein n=1 Tax=Povalibacter sp. TaxID=1962978 RepID=UPI002F40BDA1